MTELFFILLALLAVVGLWASLPTQQPIAYYWPAMTYEQKFDAMRVTLPHFPVFAELRQESVQAFFPMAASTNADFHLDTFGAFLADTMLNAKGEPCIHPGVFAIDSTTPQYCYECFSNVPACDL